MNKVNEKIEIGKIKELLKNAEDNGSFYDSLYELYVILGIKKGVQDIKNGNCITLQQFNAEREALYESASRRFG